MTVTLALSLDFLQDNFRSSEKVPKESRESLTPETLAEGRAKRMRGILRLLNSPKMKVAIGDLNKQTRYILVLCRCALRLVKRVREKRPGHAALL